QLPPLHPRDAPRVALEVRPGGGVRDAGPRMEDRYVGRRRATGGGSGAGWDEGGEGALGGRREANPPSRGTRPARVRDEPCPRPPAARWARSGPPPNQGGQGRARLGGGAPTGDRGCGRGSAAPRRPRPPRWGALTAG